MALFAKDKDSIMQESIDLLKSYTSITSLGPGSRFRALLEILSAQLSQAYETFDFNTAIGFIYGARGQYLDFLGDIFTNTRRRLSQAASTSAQSNIVKFYVSTGTFGSINNGQDIYIPAGTSLWAMRDGKKILYQVLKGITLDKSENTAYVEVQARNSGSDSNIQTGALHYHGFEDYKDFANGSLMVTNESSIENGQDEESDDNYRFRIINEQFALAKGNSNAIRLAALAIPGVADVKLYDNFFGASTSMLLVKSTVPTVSDKLISNVQQAVDEVKSAGTSIIVRAPFYINMEFTIKPTYKNALTTKEQELAESTMKNIITDYINNLDIGETFSANTLGLMLLDNTPLLTALGTANKFFESIFIVSVIADKPIRTQIVADYTPKTYEKLTILTNAIKFIS